jgi:hypothetical protein
MMRVFPQLLGMLAQDFNLYRGESVAIAPARCLRQKFLLSEYQNAWIPGKLMRKLIIITAFFLVVGLAGLR